jgi:hypothetical protein
MGVWGVQPPPTQKKKKFRSFDKAEPNTVDFFLFPRLNSIMKGARFADVAGIQERVTAVLRSIPKEAFPWKVHP